MNRLKRMRMGGLMPRRMGRIPSFESGADDGIIGNGGSGNADQLLEEPKIDSVKAEEKEASWKEVISDKQKERDSPIELPVDPKPEDGELAALKAENAKLQKQATDHQSGYTKKSQELAKKAEEIEALKLEIEEARTIPKEDSTPTNDEPNEDEAPDSDIYEDDKEFHSAVDDRVKRALDERNLKSKEDRLEVASRDLRAQNMEQLKAGLSENVEGWEATINSSRFKDWRSSNPNRSEEMLEKYDEFDYRGLGDVISAFNADVNSLESARSKNKAKGNIHKGAESSAGSASATETKESFSEISKRKYNARAKERGMIR